MKGLRVRGGSEVDVAWMDGELPDATVHSSNGSPLKIRYKDEVVRRYLAIVGNDTWTGQQR